MLGLSDGAIFDLQNGLVALLLLVFIAYVTLLKREQYAGKCLECGDDLDEGGRCSTCLDANERPD